MVSERFAYIWQYTIRTDCRTEFLAAYAPQGEWARLFSREPSYLETRLMQDIDNADRYLTIDYWKSKDDRDSFRERYSAEFTNLDSKCEALTETEEFLGDFTEIGGTFA